MKNRNKSQIFAYLLILLPLVLITIRVKKNSNHTLETNATEKFDVSYDFTIYNQGAYKVKTFMPIENHRQKIISKITTDNEAPICNVTSEGNVSLIWEGLTQKDKNITYRFEFTGQQINYHIDSTIALVQIQEQIQTKSTLPEKYIQSEDESIQMLAGKLSVDQHNGLKVLKSLFEYVYKIPSSTTNELTDAVSALENNEASCNGKSRLFVALCRNLKIPSRVAGGIILENTNKKTSHLWAEVYIDKKWIPFDPLNGHFASIPSNYLEIYKGDLFLITRNTEIDFNYIYKIKRSRNNSFPQYAILNLWSIIDNTSINKSFLMVLMLLPLGAFLVAIFKNVVGLKTFGVFLPVLIAFALMETGLLSGLILFTSILVLIGLINYPLEKWGILYTPKMVVMLTAVVIACLVSIKVLFHLKWADPSITLHFPIVILTITAERFARKIEEESLKDALSIYFQTILVALACFTILSSQIIQNVILSFPETLFIIAGLSLLLGRWIGLRITEFKRFYQIKSEQYA